MNKTKIEWCDYTINPVKGLCPMACSYCYARRMYKRFKWNPEIRFDRKALDQLAEIKKPSRIFVGSTIELFGDWIKWWWLKTTLDFCLLYPQHTFIFLTKQPQNLIKWSPFPDNCWIGVSCTSMEMLNKAINFLPFISSEVKFVSFEPLLLWECPNSELDFVFQDSSINWVIIGQQTPYSPKTAPKIEWVTEIVEACDKAKIPVFLKGNLTKVLSTDRPFYKPLPLSGWDDNFSWELRQEYPLAVR